MIFEDFLTPFLPVHHLSTDISTRPEWVLPIQMMGGEVSLSE